MSVTKDPDDAEDWQFRKQFASQWTELSSQPLERTLQPSQSRTRQANRKRQATTLSSGPGKLGEGSFHCNLHSQPLNERTTS